MFKVSKTTPLELRVAMEPPLPAEAKKSSRKRRASSKATVDSDDDEEYEVQKVVGHYCSETGMWFLLQWKGYETLTWSHEDDLDCSRLVSNYFKGFGRSTLEES